MLKSTELFEITQKAIAILSGDLKMMELGSQGIDVPGINEKIAKNYFESIGIAHTSIDLDGLHGSIKLDLTTPLAEFYGKFDIVTNFGTSEHVHGQFECFRNIHHFCKEGGIMIHSVPLPGHWQGHSKYHYSIDFFTKLSEICNYRIYENKIVLTPGGLSKGKRGQATVVFRKKKTNDFASRDEFAELPISIEDYRINHNNFPE